MLGTKFKIISGYGTTEQRLAVERGEVDGICGLSWSTLKASNPDWTENHRLNVLVQTGTSAQPDLPKVPLLVDLVADHRRQEGDRAAVLLRGDGAAVPDAARHTEGDGDRRSAAPSMRR